MGNFAENLNLGNRVRSPLLWFYHGGETYKNMFYGSKNAVDCMLFKELVSLCSIYLKLVEKGL